MNYDPCENCLRWPECNGVDANTCPLCRREEEMLKAATAAPADAESTHREEGQRDGKA